ncbi:MAG: LuxR C-terminal-related transcriptional regulator [Chloroflexota bacterium]|nr:LuxR C-terminal-related transcriptional regulator [Chloroflexota bacterium]
MQGIFSSAEGFSELESQLLALAQGRSEPLVHQYVRIARAATQQAGRDVLNVREKEILSLVAADLTDQEIAERTGLSVRTVHSHLSRIYAKLGVGGRAGAVALGIVRRLISGPCVRT